MTWKLVDLKKRRPPSINSRGDLSLYADEYDLPKNLEQFAAYEVYSDADGSRLGVKLLMEPTRLARKLSFKKGKVVFSFEKVLEKLQLDLKKKELEIIYDHSEQMVIVQYDQPRKRRKRT